MTTTEWAAWIGAVTGVVGLGWNVYLRLSAGPKLTVLPTADIVIMPTLPGNPKFISISVTNRGTTPTTITALGLCVYDSWWDAKRRRGSQYFAVKNSQLPLKLEVGPEWRPLAQQDQKVEELLRSGKLWVTISHSFSKRPAQARVRYVKA